MKITPQDLYACKVNSGLSASTVSHVHFVVNRVLKQALRWNVILRNVAELVDPLRRKTADHQPFDVEEIATFRASVPGHRYEPFWNLLLSAGLRTWRGRCFALVGCGCGRRHDKFRSIPTTRCDSLSPGLHLDLHDLIPEIGIGPTPFFPW